MKFLLEKEIEGIKRRARIALKEGIDESLRGWSWDRPPVAPFGGPLLGVSAIAMRYCETYRDIYLRYVARKRLPLSAKVIRGFLIHRLFYETIRFARERILALWPFRTEDLEKDLIASSQPLEASIQATRSALGAGVEEGDLRRAESLYRFLVRHIVCSVERVRMRHSFPNAESVVDEALPTVAERRVDGSRVGLSKDLSVDLVEGNVILEIKTGDVRPFHELAVAGYALALEAETSMPFDAGLILYVSFYDNGDPRISVREVLVDDGLRREFLEARDEAVEVVMEGIDPGRPASCPPFCPWRAVCGAGD